MTIIGASGMAPRRGRWGRGRFEARAFTPDVQAFACACLTTLRCVEGIAEDALFRFVLRVTVQTGCVALNRALFHVVARRFSPLRPRTHANPSHGRACSLSADVTHRMFILAHIQLAIVRSSATTTVRCGTLGHTTRTF